MTITSHWLMNGLQLLLDAAVKSLILMLAALALAILLRRASAATRHWVWSAALIGLLALPVLSLILPSWRIDLLPALPGNADSALAKLNRETEIPAVETRTELGEQEAGASQNHASQPALDLLPQAPARSLDGMWPFPIPSMLKAYRMLKLLDWAAVALAFWAFGMLLVIARLVAGTLRVGRLAKSASLVKQNSWLALAQALAERLRLRGGIELRRSEHVPMPMTWGAWRAVVMLPAEADEWPQECRSIVLLHELAHVKRRDCLTQTLAQIACAFYWFNPLVWFAVRQLNVEREVACDDQVLQVGTKASEYASHLVEIALSYTAGPELSSVSVGMACSELESRVRSILDPDVQRRGLNRVSAGLIALGAVFLVLSLAVVQPWSKATASPANVRSLVQTDASPEGQRQADTKATDVGRQSPKAPADETEKANTTERETREAEEARQQEATQAAPESDEQDGSQTKAQSSELTANQIIEMKTAGVTPEFIEAMRKQGFDKLTVRELTQLSLHGVNADYIKQARSWGGDKLTVREIVNLKISGVTPEYFGAMKQSVSESLTARQLAELRIHGVTPEFVETMRRVGYDKLTANQLSSLKIHGVDEAFVKEMQNWTGSKPSINELLQIKIHGVTPEFARRMKAIGFDTLSINKLSEMKIHGVDEQFVKEMHDQDFDNLTVNQLIQMRVHGVDAEYVKKLRAAGLKNVSVNQMIEMKVTGIDEILLKEKR